MFAIEYTFYSGRKKLSAPFPASQVPAKLEAIEHCGIVMAKLIRVDNPPTRQP